ncbi:MAG: biopolymer transporter ExbD [Candidatus Palauibacterales bacterium]|jgi:biopolymer transport protein ExbD|nr:biopolymer transporter ExbD [Candidatus Palauibacterales bacterium]MDP2483593.1 biopolymer transporter ExbD [Candidatus Palauibacterales bacterium]
MAAKKGFERKSGASSDIPSSSMADIAFLLLIFFMVSTVFRKEKKRNIEWTTAEATEKIDEKRKNILHIWVEADGTVYMNDQIIPYENIADVVRPIYAENRELVVAIRGDRDVPYSQINTITEQLQASGAVRVTFATRVEQRVQRARR